MTVHIMELQRSGETIDEAQIAAYRRRYGLDLPWYGQYGKWIWGVLTRGDFGRSFEYQREVSELIAERLPLTVIVTISATLFAYCVAIPIGIYCATRQYSISDYVFTIIGFIGVATPPFLLALVVMVLIFEYFGLSVGGLFSTEFENVPWSFARFVDLLKHLPVPMIVIGLSGAAGTIRVMRGCLLDELRKQYVTTARAKGVSELKLLFKYPVRIAINPMISTVGYLLPAIVSGASIAAIVLNLPTVGPLLLRATLSQDVYLSGTIVMFLALLTFIGTFISDILLGIVDPRIRMERGA
jgi:peptide/nickel transport system permease protein